MRPMSKRFQYARHSLERAKCRLKELDELWLKHWNNLTDERRIEIQERDKEGVDKGSPALDYCAAEILERCNGRPPAAGTRVYFPVVPKAYDPTKFREYVAGKDGKGGKIPGIDTRSDLIDLLASFQEFYDSNKNDWLPVFD